MSGQISNTNIIVTNKMVEEDELDPNRIARKNAEQQEKKVAEEKNKKDEKGREEVKKEQRDKDWETMEEIYRFRSSR